MHTIGMVPVEETDIRVASAEREMGKYTAIKQTTPYIIILDNPVPLVTDTRMQSTVNTLQ